MKPLEFLFALLTQFIRFEPGRITQLRDQAAAWEKETKDKPTAIGKLLVKSELWYVQVGLAICFLFGVKSISNWMMQAEDPNLLDEDDEEDADVPIRSHRKFNLN